MPNISRIELAEIVANLIADGHLQVRRIGKRTKYDCVAFFSKEESELRRFNHLIYKNFGVRGRIREWESDKRISYILSSADVVRYLLKAGVTSGSKFSSDFTVPLWITADNEITRVFLRRCFTCDGSILYDKNRERWVIHFTTHKDALLIHSGKKYLNRIRELLSELTKSTNVMTSDRYVRPSDGKSIVGLQFKIYDKQSIINYARYIGFDLNSKNARSEGRIMGRVLGGPVSTRRK